jgi:hypothetical protein
MALLTQARRFVSSRRCACQPITLNTSVRKIGPLLQSLPLLKRLALPQVVLHPAASWRSFHALLVRFPSSCASSPFATRGLHSSVQKESMNVQIGHPCIDSIFQYGFADPGILKDFLERRSAVGRSAGY